MVQPEQLRIHRAGVKDSHYDIVRADNESICPPDGGSRPTVYFDGCTRCGDTDSDSYQAILVAGGRVQVLCSSAPHRVGNVRLLSDKDVHLVKATPV